MDHDPISEILLRREDLDTDIGRMACSKGGTE